MAYFKQVCTGKRAVGGRAVREAASVDPGAEVLGWAWHWVERCPELEALTLPLIQRAVAGFSGFTEAEIGSWDAGLLHKVLPYICVCHTCKFLVLFRSGRTISDGTAIKLCYLSPWSSK